MSDYSNPDDDYEAKAGGREMSPMQLNHTMTQLRAELELAQIEIERLQAHGASILKEYGKAQEEIEWLRAELREWRDCGPTMQEAAAKLNSLRAEIERLRADNLRLAECESETWKQMKADNERLRAIAEAEGGK